MCWPDNWAISQNLVFICFLKNICTFDVHLVTVFWLTATVYTKQIALCSSDRRSLNMSEISTRRSHRDSLLRPQLRHCSLIQVSDDTHWLKAASIYIQFLVSNLYWFRMNVGQFDLGTDWTGSLSWSLPAYSFVPRLRLSCGSGSAAAMVPGVVHGAIPLSLELTAVVACVQ